MLPRKAIAAIHKKKKVNQLLLNAFLDELNSRLTRIISFSCLTLDLFKEFVLVQLVALPGVARAGDVRRACAKEAKETN